MKNNNVVEIECIDCKKPYDVNHENLKQISVTCDDNKLEVLYVDCPYCGKRHYVQIDDEESNKMRVKALVMFKKLSEKKLSGRRVGKLEASSFEKLRNKLSEARTKLMSEYEGRIVTDTLTGRPVELHFTYC